ncbi:hypothetical protein Tco_0070669 [Tanacetum coccineum]
MLNPNPDTGIDSILNPNIESTSLVDVLVTTNDKIPPSSVTTLPPPPIPLIQPLQQTLVSTPTIVTSTSLQNLSTFGSLFKFENRVKSLEDDFSKFKKTNLFAEAVSSIPSIVDKYLANKMNEAVKQLFNYSQTDLETKLKLKMKTSSIQLMQIYRKSSRSKSKYKLRSKSLKFCQELRTNLSELELKKIPIDKMGNNKSIDRSVQQKTLYKALVDAYENDKDILTTYGDTVTLKRRQDDKDEDDEPSAGSNRGSKRTKAGKEPESTSAPKYKTSKSTDSSKEGSKSKTRSTGKSAQAEEQVHTVKDLEEPAHQEFKTGFTEDHPVDETTQLPDWFQKPAKPPTPDRDWNKTLPAVHGPIQPWISTLAQKEGPRELFNELIDTPLDFSAFVLNRLKVDTLTPELLAGLIFELMKGSCKSLVELEYFLEEVYKATTDQLDWNNPKGQQYPHDLRKPLPLIPNSRGCRIIPFDHFINNNLAYLSGGVLSQTYATSVMKTKVADYGHIKWIEDLVPNTMWSQVPIVYDKHALWGISHWGKKRQQFYGYTVHRESARDVYSRNRSIAIKKLTIVEWHNYKHLDWITIRRDDDKLYTFKKGDYNRLYLQDIEDMLLLLAQGKLTNLNIKERLALGVSLSDLKRKIAYTAYSNPKGFIYQNQDKKNRLMRINELHKFSDGTLNDVRSALDDTLKRIRMKNRRIMRSLEKFIGGRLYGGDLRLLGRTLSYVVLISQVKMEILLEPTSNKLMAERFDTSTGNPIKDILLKLNLPDHSDEVLKLKNFKKDVLLKLFKKSNQERYEHVGPKVTSSQDGKAYKMAKRDYAWLMISRYQISKKRKKTKPKRQNRARERKERERKVKSKPKVKESK